MFTTIELSVLHKTDKMTASLYVNKLRKYWCPFVQSSGRCDNLCSIGFCAPHIREITSKIFDTVRSRDAVLLFRIRNQKARLAEEWSKEEKEPIKTTSLGEVKEGNIFSMMAGD